MNAQSRLLGSTLLVLSSAALLGPSAARADIITFIAVDDFPTIDAGDVPYYSEVPARDSLAINAANQEYRNRFARATVHHEGESDFYDITLTALAELAGEAQYRVLINDVLVGTASNPEVETDYTPVRHTFEDIVVPNGALIAVESLANTNGKLPEGNGAAFARGRWTRLELDNGDADTVVADEVDLTLSASMDDGQVQVGDVFTLSLDISNSDTSAVATSLQLALTRPRAEVALASATSLACQESGNDILCELSELPAGNTTTVSINLQALAVSPNALLRATMTTDQNDSNPVDNVLTLPLSIKEPSDELSDETGTPATGTVPTDEAASAQTDNGSPDKEQADSEPLGDVQADNSLGEGITGDSSGGGTLSSWMMLLLATVGMRPLYQRLRYSPSSASGCDRCR